MLPGWCCIAIAALEPGVRASSAVRRPEWRQGRGPGWILKQVRPASYDAQSRRESSPILDWSPQGEKNETHPKDYVAIQVEFSPLGYMRKMEEGIFCKCKAHEYRWTGPIKSCEFDSEGRWLYRFHGAVQRFVWESSHLGSRKPGYGFKGSVVSDLLYGDSWQRQWERREWVIT